MFKIKTLNEIAPEGLQLLDGSYAVSESVDSDGILVRSANLLEMNFSPELKAIARAGVGVNNIPISPVLNSKARRSGSSV